MLRIVSKESRKALIKLCMVIGMSLNSVSEGVLAFWEMLMCSEKDVSGCVSDGFGVMVFLLVWVCGYGSAGSFGTCYLD